ncbi:MAG TPA: MarP family serine protease [Candidatus Limnocylindrales bacterium]|nr:MarP family serine protease [Candidatus Limnocylindrales bacterium]
MNALDLAALVLVVLSVVLGARSGALPQIAGLVGAAGGAVIGFVLLPLASPLLVGLPPPVRAVLTLGVLLGLIGLGEGLGAGVGRMGSRLLGRGVLGALDQVAGALVGFAQAVLIVWLMGGVLASGPFPNLSQLAQTSRALRIVDGLLPPPTELVVELGNLLDDTGLPDVFLGLEPLPAQGIDLPSDAVARRIGEAAAKSVLLVVADGCQLESRGTSFIVSAGYLVTNAHVVAGARTILVRSPTASFTATPVLVDLELDIAVLHVSGLDEPALHFAPDPAPRTIGATFGYPGGGNASVEPATAAAVYDATGLDVTGTHRVTRRLVELRAHVVPGDSGGPFLLADGSVGGVVFAESRADPSVGYALSPEVVASRIAPALDQTQEVSTGPCTH